MKSFEMALWKFWTKKRMMLMELLKYIVSSTLMIIGFLWKMIRLMWGSSWIHFLMKTFEKETIISFRRQENEGTRENVSLDDVRRNFDDGFSLDNVIDMSNQYQRGNSAELALFHRRTQCYLLEFIFKIAIKTFYSLKKILFKTF
jgi:hypothetical protein